MSFEFNVVTSAGANLIANATAANPIVLIGALSSATEASSKEDLAAKDISFYVGKSGTIFAASAQDNVARIIMSFNNQNLQNSQLIKSACILGRLQSQTDSDAVIIAAISDSNSQISIPDSTAPLISIHIPINIAINADDNVATVGAEYASSADLERFVSTHKAGDPTQGDNQEILGEKTFDNTIYSLSGVDPAIVQRYENDDNISFGGGSYYQNPAFQAPIDFLSTGIEITAAPAKHIMWTGGSQSSETTSTHSIYFSSMMEAGGGSYTSYTTIRSDIQKTSTNGLGAVVLEAKESTNSATSTLEVSTNKSIGGEIYSRVYGKSNNVDFDSSQFVVNSSATPGQTSNVPRAKISSVVNTNGLFDKGLIQFLCYDSENTGISLNFTALSVDEQDSSNNRYSFYPLRLGGSANHIIDLGTQNAKFNHVYADEFNGTVDKALNDNNGNAITSYYRGASTSGSSIDLTKGNDTGDSVVLNPCVAMALTGREVAIDSIYTRVGGIGLFLYTGSATSGAPGDTVSGSDLTPAGLVQEYGGAVVVKRIPSLATESGSWGLLSYFSTTNSGDAPVVLAVKVSTT